MAKEQKPKTKRTGPNIKPHLYSRDIEWAIMRVSQNCITAEKKALRFFLANCMDVGYTEKHIAAKLEEFLSDDRTKTLGLRYFKKMLERDTPPQHTANTNYSEAF